MKRRLDLFIAGPNEFLSIEEAEQNELACLGFLQTMVAAATVAITAKWLDNLMAKKNFLV